MGTAYKQFSFPVCMNCTHHFWYGEMMFHSKHGYRNFICQKCSERENMPNIKITVEVDGKIVPLNTISTESFETIKALEKPKEIPVARLAEHHGSSRLLLKPTEFVQLIVGNIYVFNIKNGVLTGKWKLKNDNDIVALNYYDIQSL